MFVLHDGAEAVRKHRQRFANHFYIRQCILRFHPPAPMNCGKSDDDASGQPGSPRQPRHDAFAGLNRRLIAFEAAHNPAGKHFRRPGGNFRQARPFQDGFKFRCVHGEYLSRDASVFDARQKPARKWWLRRSPKFSQPRHDFDSRKWSARWRHVVAPAAG